MKIGNYVKFKDKRGSTYIRKIKDLLQDIRYGAIEIDIEANYSNMLSFKNIIKTSPNIIDLIEVGDYVNGCIVINKKDDTIQIIQLIIPFDLKEKDIKSIVTKEQFEAIKYEIK